MYRIHGRPERRQGFEDVGLMFMPLFERYGVDAVLTAHLHTYRNRGHLWQLDESPDGRGPLYLLTGLTGNVRYPGLWIDHDLDRVKAPQPETDNFLTLEADADSLRFACYLPDGTKIDEATLTK